MKTENSAEFQPDSEMKHIDNLDLLTNASRNQLSAFGFIKLKIVFFVKLTFSATSFSTKI